MKTNILTVNGKEYTLTEEQAKAILKDFNLDKSKLAEIDVAKTCHIGDYEFIVLEHLENGETVLILKDILENSAFGTNNNYDGSKADKICIEFGEKLASIVGEENLCEYTLDLTSGNGMKCYGEIKRKCSLLNLDLFRKYGEILVNYGVDYQWLATACETEKWGTSNYAFCVAPSGNINNNNYNNNNGVRPFWWNVRQSKHQLKSVHPHQKNAQPFLKKINKKE